MKLAEVCPAGTVICGTVAASWKFELSSLTIAPPAGAAEVSVTMPVDAAPLPPEMLEGTSCRRLTLCAWATGNALPNASKLKPSAVKHLGSQWVGLMVFSLLSI